MAPIQSDDLNHFDFTQSVVGEPMIQLLRREANYRVPALRQFGTGRDRLLLADSRLFLCDHPRLPAPGYGS